MRCAAALGWLMIFAALVLLCPVGVFGGVDGGAVEAVPAVTVVPPSDNSEETATVVLASATALPELPFENVAGPVFTAERGGPSTPEPKADAMAFQPATPAPAAAARPAGFAFEPVKPVSELAYESPAKKRIWFGLMAAGHAGAALDAWSTRRALSGNYGTEADPLMRPFAHSWTLYAATQVLPTVMDFVGKRAMRSEHALVRKMWWVPQSVSATMSFQAGVHNIGVVP
jgi:hypothetical protein